MSLAFLFIFSLFFPPSFPSLSRFAISFPLPFQFSLFFHFLAFHILCTWQTPYFSPDLRASVILPFLPSRPTVRADFSPGATEISSSLRGIDLINFIKQPTRTKIITLPTFAFNVFSILSERWPPRNPQALSAVRQDSVEEKNEHHKTDVNNRRWISPSCRPQV